MKLKNLKADATIERNWFAYVAQIFIPTPHNHQISTGYCALFFSFLSVAFLN